MGACISFFFFLIWSIVDWQCCIRFRHIAESLTHIQVCIIFIVFSCIGYYVEYSSLYYTVGPCWLSILYILASIRWEGNGTPVQHSCLENPMDGGAWWAAVHGVARSQTRLSGFAFTFHFHHWRRQWHPTPVLFPGKPHGQRSLVGCRLWGHRVGHDWSDLAAAAADRYIYMYMQFIQAICVCIYKILLTYLPTSTIVLEARTAVLLVTYLSRHQ